MSANRLANETSPYLRQHAGNPVDWYPWGEEALERARAEDKPILLSIGYSACHWCHVMAHESFEDPDIAVAMNERFVNIKVDREERPDLDRIYQLAHQALAQRAGGWPLTMFLDPQDQTPFFGGTYFPAKSRYGMPSFPELLQRVDQLFRERRDEIREQNTSMREVLAKVDRVEPEREGVLDDTPIRAARRELEEIFDPQHGGFGQAPKFPHPMSVDLLLRHWSETHRSGAEDQRGLHMALLTLERMALGGMYDQVGGGFARYSVDDRWMIPHFEKMLYDNGQLLATYATAAAMTGNDLLRQTAEETADWALREMLAPEGAFYSSLDADSEGEEGKFYVWDRDEARSCVDDDVWTVIETYYGFDRAANFEGKAWHPHCYRDRDALAEQLDLDRAEIDERIERGRGQLFQRRAARVRPGRDDKILTAWNALMIRGLARAGRYLGRDDLTDAAYRALGFIRQTMWRDGRLLASYKDGRAHLPAYLDDYAYLLEAIVELLQARWDNGTLEFAQELARTLVRHFHDADNGGFFFTADDHEALIQRPRPLTDDSMPSGNGAAALAFGRLGHLLAEPRYLDYAEGTLRAAWAGIQRVPHGHCKLLQAHYDYLSPPELIVLRGDNEHCRDWQAALARRARPQRLVFTLPDDDTGLADPLRAYRVQAPVTAYICTGHDCRPPVTDWSDLLETLGEHASG